MVRTSVSLASEFRSYISVLRVCTLIISPIVYHPKWQLTVLSITLLTTCLVCIGNVVILFHIILTCTEKELLWSLNINFEILMGISVFGYHKLKKVLLFTKYLSVYMSYSALERNLFDRFPPNSQQTYKVGQYIRLL